MLRGSWSPLDLPIIVNRHSQLNAIKCLTNSKPAGPDNIPGELLNDMITDLVFMCNKILSNGEWPEEWTKSIVIAIPKKASRKCGDYRTISLMSYPSQLMLKIIQKRIDNAINFTLDDAQA